MSPRRWGVNTRVWAYRFLVLRDGEKCANPDCPNGRVPTTQNTLDIDHINGLDFDNDPDNLQLLCRSCNVAKENGARLALASPSLGAASPTTSNQTPSAQCVRERKEGRSETRVAREAVDYSQGGVEMKANYLYEVQFRHWLMEKVAQRGSIEKGDAIAAGAEVVGCSPATSAKYLAKLTSTAGPLKEVKGMLGEKSLTLKDHLQTEMFLDDPRGVGHSSRRVSAHREESRPSRPGMSEAEESEPTTQSASRQARLSLGASDPR